MAMSASNNIDLPNQRRNISSSTLRGDITKCL